MTHFTPLSALIGGILIGLSATLMFLFFGRITGVSGIASNLIRSPTSENRWRLFFIAGLLLGGLFYHFSTVAHFPLRQNVSPYWLILAGLLVGFGTQLGSGCTSGHGVCGMARLSKRSFIATSLFLIAGIMTVYFMRHILGAWHA